MSSKLQRLSSTKQSPTIRQMPKRRRRTIFGFWFFSKSPCELVGYSKPKASLFPLCSIPLAVRPVCVAFFLSLTDSDKVFRPSCFLSAWPLCPENVLRWHFTRPGCPHASSGFPCFGGSLSMILRWLPISFSFCMHAFLYAKA